MTKGTAQKQKQSAKPNRERQAGHTSLRKAGALVLPVVVMAFFPSLFMIFPSMQILGEATTNLGVYLRMAWVALLILSPFMLVILGGIHLAKTSASFLLRFYDLPDFSTARQVTSLRVLGVMPVPALLAKRFKFPSLEVKDGKVNPEDHWAFSIGGPLKLKIEKGNALYLEKNGMFARIVEQEDDFLNWDETLFAAVNAEPRTETFNTTAWTKDGIKITVFMKSEFSLGAERKEEEDERLIPLEAQMIRNAVENTFKRGKNANEWFNEALGQIKRIVGTEIAKKYLDELFIEEASKTNFLSSENMNKLVGTLQTELRKQGVILTSFQVTDIQMNKHILEKRLKVWETKREILATISDGEAKAHKIRLQEKARAEVQRNLILTIANRLNRIGDADFPEHFLLSISGLLDSSMKNPEVRAELGREVLETLEKLQQTVKLPLNLPDRKS